MTRGVRIRLTAFLVLSAVGITYVSASFLGLVDAALGRGTSVQTTLPRSAGLFVGSEVTYRGVQVGEVTDLTSTQQGVTVDVDLEDGVQVPRGTAVYVHNLSAVGEQYLDFVPDDGGGPYLAEGDVVTGGAASVPVDEGDLLIDLNDLVTSLDARDINTTVAELGDLFRDTGRPLQRLIDSGTRFIDAAEANKDATDALLENGLTVLDTQADQRGNIIGFARDLNKFTTTLARSDQNLRRTLQGTPGALREANALLKQLEPTLPVLLGNLVTTNQVVVSHLDGLEQLLVTYPPVISTGFTGTTKDGYGHVGLQTANEPKPCQKGYKPPSQWKQGNDLSEGPIFPARCEEGPPKVMRGTKYAPGSSGSASSGGASRPGYGPAPGNVEGAVDANGDPVRLQQQGNLSIMGGDAWKWLLVGPVKQQ